ncbi:MAG: EAL domain-containing protein [Thermoanaerobaculia bacterium]
MTVLPELTSVPPLDDILRSENLRPVFQPIVRLGDERAFGYESLARYRSDNPLLDPDFLFRYAARKNRVCDLDIACLRRSLEEGADLLPHGALFINIHPTMLTAPERWVVLLESLSRAGAIDTRRIVLEVTEQGAIDEDRVSPAVFDRLRALGIRLALDDVGAAWSQLALIDRIQPEFVKISQIFGTGFERDSAKEKIVRSIASLGRDFGCAIVLEGIETAATAEAARELEIEYGQGFHFARPTEASLLLGSA